jgi:hypothetical protein
MFVQIILGGSANDFNQTVHCLKTGSGTIAHDTNQNVQMSSIAVTGSSILVTVRVEVLAFEMRV